MAGTAQLLRVPHSQSMSNQTHLEQLDLDTSGDIKPVTTPESLSYSSSYQSTIPSDIESKAGLVNPMPEYRVYKLRWFGLIELTFLNLVIGWGNTAPGVVSTTATKWYGISYSHFNYLSEASLLVFIVPIPITIWVLNKSGPRLSIWLACFLSVVGNWIVYAATKTHSFPINIAGSIIAALASPFVLAAPTRYSRLWFSDQGRTFATACPSLAYPLGAGIGSLTGPVMLKPVGTLNYDQQALIVAILFTAVALPAVFLPARPPTPPSHVAAATPLSIPASLRSLSRNPSFYLQFISFTIFAGAFDATASVANQLLHPYGFSQINAGTAVACMIFIGIAAALIISPILDRTKSHLVTLKIIVPIIALGYTTLPFIPQTHSAAGVFVVYAIIGAASLATEPCVLEFQATWTHPVSPEFSSVICWAGAKVMAAIMILLVGNDLWLKKPASGQPEGSVFWGLICQAALVWICVPFSLMTGLWIFKRQAASKVEGNE